MAKGQKYMALHYGQKDISCLWLCSAPRVNRDVTYERGLCDKPMSHLEHAVLEMFLLIMC